MRKKSRAIVCLKREALQTIDLYFLEKQFSKLQLQNNDILKKCNWGHQVKARAITSYRHL